MHKFNSIVLTVFSIVMGLLNLPVSVASAQSVFVSNGSGANVSIGSMSGGSVTINGNTVSSSSKVVAGVGPDKSERRELGAYSGLRLDAPVDVAYTIGGPLLLTVHGPANILPLVTTVVEGGQLTIGIKGAVSLSRPLKVVVSGPSLAEVRSNGTGKLNILGVNGKELRIKLSGSGSVSARGEVDKLVASVSGSASLDASALKAKAIEVSVSGSGQIASYSSLEARAEVSGSGSILIHGQPARRQVDKTGSGQIAFR